jgi:hypothetical protein
MGNNEQETSYKVLQVEGKSYKSIRVLDIIRVTDILRPCRAIVCRSSRTLIESLVMPVSSVCYIIVSATVAQNGNQSTYSGTLRTHISPQLASSCR